MRRKQLLTAIERLALGTGMSLAAVMLELVLKRRMRRSTAAPAAPSSSATDAGDPAASRREPLARA